MKERTPAVTARLQRLQKKFPAMRHPSDLDKDQRYLTKDARVAIPGRTFFLGELFWVEREGWNGCGGFYSNPSRDHHPGLVVRKESRPYLPVDMAPGTTKPRHPPKQDKRSRLFRPQRDVAWKTTDRDHPAEQAFVLNYRRPVARQHIGLALGRLHYDDSARLQQELRAMD